MFDWTKNVAGHDHVDRTPQAFLRFQLETHGLSDADVRVAPRVVATYQTYLYADLTRLTGASRSDGWRRLVDEVPVAHGRYQDVDVTVIRFPIGAPAAVSFLEQVAVCGARSLVSVGTAGGLRRDVRNGAAVLPTRAIRQEGSSYHYRPPEVEARPDPDLLTCLRDACSRRGVTVREGTVWTTDAPFRETMSDVRRLAGRDAIAVDMEASALFVVGAMRSLRVASLFIVSDELFHPWIPARIDGPYLESAARLAGSCLDGLANAPAA